MDHEPKNKETHREVDSLLHKIKKSEVDKAKQIMRAETEQIFPKRRFRKGLRL